MCMHAAGHTHSLLHCSSTLPYDNSTHHSHGVISCRCQLYCCSTCLRQEQETANSQVLVVSDYTSGAHSLNPHVNCSCCQTTRQMLTQVLHHTDERVPTTKRPIYTTTLSHDGDQVTCFNEGKHVEVTQSCRQCKGKFNVKVITKGNGGASERARQPLCIPVSHLGSCPGLPAGRHRWQRLTLHGSCCQGCRSMPAAAAHAELTFNVA